MLAMATSGGTKDLETLRAMGDPGKFAIELRNAMALWKRHREKQTGRYEIRNVEFAHALGIANASLSRYLNGIQMPEAEVCKRIAELTGTAEDYWRKLARRPNFTDFLEQIVDDPPLRKRAEEANILYLLEATQFPKWRNSRSFWKERAESVLDEQWGNPDVFGVAVVVAEYILAWVIDYKRRDIPFHQRPQEAII